MQKPRKAFRLQNSRDPGIIIFTHRSYRPLSVLHGDTVAIHVHDGETLGLSLSKVTNKAFVKCIGRTNWNASQATDRPSNKHTVIILNIGTDRSEQTLQTQIRLLLMEQSDQGLLCLLFCLHLLNTLLHCKIQLFQL